MLLLAPLLSGAILAAQASPVLAYSGPNAATYADSWALKDNPYYPSYSSDFTNFVSQAVYAGGYPFRNYQQNVTDARWYYYQQAAGAVGGSTLAIAADSSQVPLVKSAFTAAITADQQSGAPATAATAASTTAGPAAVYRSKVDAAVAAKGLAPAADVAVRQAQQQDGKRVLTKYFAPGQAKHEEIGLNNAVTAEADQNSRNIGAGVCHVKYDEVAVSGNTATLVAEVTIWSKFQQLQSNGKWTTSDPVNVMIYHVTMERGTSGQWVVNSMVGDFAPGQAP